MFLARSEVFNRKSRTSLLELLWFAFSLLPLKTSEIARMLYHPSCHGRLEERRKQRGELDKRGRFFISFKPDEPRLKCRQFAQIHRQIALNYVTLTTFFRLSFYACCGSSMAGVMPGHVVAQKLDLF